jgi:hypothetical protein
VREKRIKERGLGGCFFAWLFVITLHSAMALPIESGVEVVVNESVHLQSVSITTVRAIFGMRLRTWPNSAPIQVFVLADDHPAHVAFCKGILNIFPHQIRLAWDRLVFSGTGQAPYQVRTEREMRLLVATTPGAIGYLGDGMIDRSVRVPTIKQ